MVVGFVVGAGLVGALTQSACTVCRERLEQEQLEALKRGASLRPHRKKTKRELLVEILMNQGRIMATQEELAAQLTAAAAKAEKIGNETRALLTKIEELLAALAAGATVSPEVQAAADAVTTQLEVVDTLVPDA